MSARYKEFQQLNLPAIEKEVLAEWEAGKAFEKSVSIREDAEPFVFYEGPPSANGMPGIHHVISRTLKDLVCRYKTMQGFQVKRKGGWDTHGLPVELQVEKELGITKEDIGKKISVEEYNQKCRETVLRYKDKWDDLTTKMGYWVDLQQPYITFDNNYIESLWWLLKKMYDRGLLYESVSIQPYSPAAGTGLSSHELNQPGTYKDVKDTSATVMFRAVQDEKNKFLHDAVHGAEVFFMAWTTTPWTLPSNLGLTVGPNIDYVLVQTFNPYTHLPVNVVLAKNLVGKYLKAEGENGDFDGYSKETKLIPWKIITEFKGKELEGCRYEQLLAFEANSLDVIRAITPDADPFRILCDTFVTTEDGTGIVHTAPAFGADDYKVGKKYNIGILTMVDREGKFVDGLGEFSNRYVKNYKDEKDYVDVNVDISVKLKLENRAFKVEKYEHSYPHCWRTDKPILYYPLDAWFIKTTALKDRMVELNKTINWKPASTGTGRFGNWLENMVDWNLSRSRYWGTPLPVWKTVDADGNYVEVKDGGEQKCIGSIEELNAEIRKANEVLGGDVNRHYLHEGILDLHKPYVDDIVLVASSGAPMKRVSDLIDVWFDSGAMPYAQWHFPFENKDVFVKNYPADFIAEGVDQTRGWFYTLHAIGSLIKEDIQEELKKAGIEAPEEKYPGVAYKTVVSNGLVLDKNGNKMSKRLGNVVNPFETIDTFGADATRWYLITNASPWDSLKFDIEGIREVQRKFFGTMYNTYQFFALYANVDGFAFKEAYIPLNERPEIDQWIISSLNTLKGKVAAAFNDYEPTTAGRLIEEFVDEHLSNWYVRLCRRRFWKGDYEHDKIAAYQTLYECLETISLLIAPVSPFFSEWLFKNLNAVSGRINAESVHHALYPAPLESAIQPDLEERMELAQNICSLVLSLRKKVNIKVRQPLQKILIPVLNPAMKVQIEKIEDLIRSEVNVKEIQYLTETDGFIKKKIKPNFVALGKKLGARMKAASAAIGEMTQDDISKIEKEGQYTLLIDSEPLILQINEVEITSEDIPGWMVATKDALTVALDVTVTPDLVDEGNARELVNRIQKIRKDNGYELTDRILVSVSGHDSLNEAIRSFGTYIAAEILADGLEIQPDLTDGIEIEVNDVPLKVLVTKKG
ncbi:isoleucine--tRNA ligase [Parasegetibacter sp. NRK P23]|uniref:isoleucine--tRNA ligase n=1 Tax=Parasegetibacter sp. NRK P23 TaxID=2942999 RepID=UPI0020430C1F|nr:isoleucine--tRNA ligase [Parasegetibacter sp. NRK P23]MCM5530199.1 isoleucine--tRNA ligase [Parasegetibacter sp. NRK P23]